MPRRKAATALTLGSVYLVSVAAAVDGQRAVYYDPNYPTCWVSGSAVRDVLVYDGYELLDADGLRAWMQARLTNDLPSVVVFSQDIAPDTVAESMSPDCTLRHYLDAAGKVVWYGNMPIYYQGHADSTKTVWDVAGSIAVLGFNAAGGPWDSNTEVSITPEGVAWGLTETWHSVRPTATGDVDVLALDGAGYPAGWVKHYVPGDTHRGFARVFDRAGTAMTRQSASRCASAAYGWAPTPNGRRSPCTGRVSNKPRGLSIPQTTLSWNARSRTRAASRPSRSSCRAIRAGMPMSTSLLITSMLPARTDWATSIATASST
jgi:hypothetical protein